MADPLRPKARWGIGIQPRSRKILVALDHQEHEVVLRGLGLWNKRRSSWSCVSLAAWARHVLLLAAEQELQRDAELARAKRDGAGRDPGPGLDTKPHLEVGTKRRDPRAVGGRAAKGKR